MLLPRTVFDWDPRRIDEVVEKQFEEELKEARTTAPWEHLPHHEPEVMAQDSLEEEVETLPLAVVKAVEKSKVVEHHLKAPETDEASTAL